MWVYSSELTTGNDAAIAYSNGQYGGVLIRTINTNAATGRVYTIKVEATDEAGNTASCSDTVTTKVLPGAVTNSGVYFQLASVLDQPQPTQPLVTTGLSTTGVVTTGTTGTTGSTGTTGTTHHFTTGTTGTTGVVSTTGYIGAVEQFNAVGQKRCKMLTHFQTIYIVNSTLCPNTPYWDNVTSTYDEFFANVSGVLPLTSNSGCLELYDPLQFYYTMVSQSVDQWLITVYLSGCTPYTTIGSIKMTTSNCTEVPVPSNFAAQLQYRQMWAFIEKV